MDGEIAVSILILHGFYYYKTFITEKSLKTRAKYTELEEISRTTFVFAR